MTETSERPLICKCCGWYGEPDRLLTELYEIGDRDDYVEVCPRCGTPELEEGTVFADLETYDEVSFEIYEAERKGEVL